MTAIASHAILIAAGGKSTRFGGNKLLAEFRGMPLICHCLKNFDAPGRRFVLAVPTETTAEFADIFNTYMPGFKGIISFAANGASRAESIANAFDFLVAQPDPPEFVSIHDAARPLASEELLLRCLDAARECGAAIAAHRTTDTIHVADDRGEILETPSRATLWAAETPQVFRTSLYGRALRELDWRKNPPTDDAQLVRQLPGTRIRLVENTSPNPKITFKHDLGTCEKS